MKAAGTYYYDSGIQMIAAQYQPDLAGAPGALTGKADPSQEPLKGWSP